MKLGECGGDEYHHRSTKRPATCVSKSLVIERETKVHETIREVARSCGDLRPRFRGGGKEQKVSGGAVRTWSPGTGSGHEISII